MLNVKFNYIIHYFLKNINIISLVFIIVKFVFLGVGSQKQFYFGIFKMDNSLKCQKVSTSGSFLTLFRTPFLKKNFILNHKKV